jgi:hypothetical protein
MTLERRDRAVRHAGGAVPVLVVGGSGGFRLAC